MSACLLDRQTTNRNRAGKMSEYYIGRSASKSICHEHAVFGDETHRTSRIARAWGRQGNRRTSWIQMHGIPTNLGPAMRELMKLRRNQSCLIRRSLSCLDRELRGVSWTARLLGGVAPNQGLIGLTPFVVGADVHRGVKAHLTRQQIDIRSLHMPGRPTRAAGVRLALSQQVAPACTFFAIGEFALRR